MYFRSGWNDLSKEYKSELIKNDAQISFDISFKKNIGSAVSFRREGLKFEVGAAGIYIDDRAWHSIYPALFIPWESVSVCRKENNWNDIWEIVIRPANSNTTILVFDRDRKLEDMCRLRGFFAH